MNHRQRMIASLFGAVIFTAYILLPIGNSKNNYNPNIILKSKPLSQKVDHKETEKKQVEESNETYWNVPLSHELQLYIRKLCKQYNIDERMVYGIIKTESNFDPNKISSTGDYGLFQVNQVNFERLRKELGISNFLNPFDNSKAGIYLLSELKHKYNDNNEVLIGYNCGENAMIHMVSRGTSFTDYTLKVDKEMRSLQKED